MNQRLGAIVLLLALIAASCWVRLDALAHKQCLERDESTAYLSAAAKQGAFANSDLANRWVDAAQWSAHHRIDEAFAFETIRRDLIEHDIHPPLYFWLLHLAGLRNGLTLTIGGQLNTAFHALACALFFGLAWLSGRRFWPAFLALTLWSFSAPVLSTSLLARQYELVALLAIASFASLCWLMESERRRGLAGLALAASLFLAAWTHYQALLLAPALAIVAALHGMLLDRRGSGRSGLIAAVAPAAGALTGALAIYFLVQPEAWSEAGGEVRVEGHGLRMAMTRLPVVLRTLTDFVPGHVSALGVALLLAAAWSARTLRRSTHPERTREDDSATRALLYSLGPALLLVTPILFLYLSFRTAQHAMGDRYLVLVWPFLALWLVQPLRWIRSPRACAVVALLGAMVCGAVGADSRFASLGRQCWPLQIELVDRYDAVVLNVARRGRIAPFFARWSEGTAVFAGRGMETFEHEEQLIEGLRDQPEAIVFHLRGQGVTQDSRARLVALLEQHGFALGPPDDPVTLIDPDAVTLLLIAPEVPWPPGLVEWVDALGVRADAGQRRGGYAVIAHRGAILTEQVASSSGSLVLRYGPFESPRLLELEARIARPVSASGPAVLSVDVGRQPLLEGAGSIALVTLDASTGKLVDRRLYLPHRKWQPTRSAFRVWPLPSGSDPAPLRAAD
jgi:hypothetical protein